MAKIKLKTCPFCGNDALLTYNTGKYGAFCYVECELCGARSKTKLLPRKPNEFYRNQEEFWEQDEFEVVAKLWNIRMSDV